MKTKGNYFYDHLGIKHRMSDLVAVEKLEKLKRDSGSSPWPVIEQCFKMWEKTRPTEYESYLIYIQDLRETRKDKKFGSSTDKVTGGIIRYTVDVPKKVMDMIRAIYSPQELPMDKKDFWKTISKI